MRKKIAVLGSTGSIGQNTLKIVKNNKDRFEITALTGGSNIDLLEKQIYEYTPACVAVADKALASALQKRVPSVRVLAGEEGLCEVASLPQVDTVVAAIVGAGGILPTVAAIKARKTIALANKEVLVAAGGYVMPLAKSLGVALLPVDSEHNAVFQCLHGEDTKSVRRIILTSSGGPFRGRRPEELYNVSVEDALRHPNFAMGSKITVDSSTMMNKGLEVIEAYRLFNLPLEAIEVLIHPQQKIHAMVEFIDGSILTEMCEPDMLVPIQYALSYPERIPGLLPPYDFARNARLDFEAPDTTTFRCLYLAYEALKIGKTMPAFMNAVNEALVSRFLQGQIPWFTIAAKLEEAMSRYKPVADDSLEAILEADRIGREEGGAI